MSESRAPGPSMNRELGRTRLDVAERLCLIAADSSRLRSAAKHNRKTQTQTKSCATDFGTDPGIPRPNHGQSPCMRNRHTAAGQKPWGLQPGFRKEGGATNVVPNKWPQDLQRSPKFESLAVLHLGRDPAREVESSWQP